MTNLAAQVVKTLPEGDDSTYELRFDGYRALIIKDEQRVELRSRKNKDLTEMLADMDRPRAEFQGRAELRDGLVESIGKSISRSQTFARYDIDRIAHHRVLGQADRLIQATHHPCNSNGDGDHIEIGRVQRQTLLDVPCGRRKVI